MMPSTRLRNRNPPAFSMRDISEVQDALWSLVGRKDVDVDVYIDVDDCVCVWFSGLGLCGFSTVCVVDADDDDDDVLFVFASMGIVVGVAGVHVKESGVQDKTALASPTFAA